MGYQALLPQQVDAFVQLLESADWRLVHQEAGQTHFIGWGYLKRWALNTASGEAICTLHYQDKQGVVEAYCEFNLLAEPLLSSLFSALLASDIP